MSNHLVRDHLPRDLLPFDPAFDPGPLPQLAMLAVKDLCVDPTYQRTLDSRRSQASIARIAEKFRWSHFGVVIVAENGDGWSIIDGQHRVDAARRRRIKTVPCLVVPAASVAEQAQIFIATNESRVTVNIYAMHHAAVAAGKPEALATFAMCADAGITIPRYPKMVSQLKPGETLAVGFLTKLANGPLAKLGLRAVSIVSRVYRDKPGGVSTNILRAAVAALSQNPRADASIEGFLARHDPKILNEQYRLPVDVGLLAEMMLRAPASADLSPEMKRRMMAGR